jgi:hypothetical protein
MSSGNRHLLMQTLKAFHRSLAEDSAHNFAMDIR